MVKIIKNSQKFLFIISLFFIIFLPFLLLFKYNYLYLIFGLFQNLIINLYYIILKIVSNKQIEITLILFFLQILFNKHFITKFLNN